jgi:hypothetical protein
MFVFRLNFPVLVGVSNRRPGVLWRTQPPIDRREVSHPLAKFDQAMAPACSADV